MVRLTTFVVLAMIWLYEARTSASDNNAGCSITSCGSKGTCQEINGIARCFKSCMIDSQCNKRRACINKMCQNPCRVNARCGQNERCIVHNHVDKCRCNPKKECKPKCMIDSHCHTSRACINNECQNPCRVSARCGQNAICRVRNHVYKCLCKLGYTGDPKKSCTLSTIRNPCSPSPCGSHTECKNINGNPSCSCIPGYFWNATIGCRPECVENYECPPDKACIKRSCMDPCMGLCGRHASCTVENHNPSCSCMEGYTEDPSGSCSPSQNAHPASPGNPCSPSPCGPHTDCKNINGDPSCSCIPGYFVNPNNIGCRPECVENYECPPDKACIHQRCMDKPSS